MISDGTSNGYAQFKDWMKEFELGPEEATLKQRWSGIAKLLKDSAVADLETLARLALKWRQTPTTTAIDRIVGFFAEDEGFAASSHARELQVLSAIGLIHIARTQTHKLAATAALLISTSLFGGPRKAALPMDIGALGEEALQTLSAGIGRRPTLPGMKAIGRFNFDAASTQLAGQGWAQAAADLKASGAAADAAVNLLASQFLAATRTFDHVLKQQDEELQMLWWLLGGRSEQLDKPFDNITGDSQALILGMELAEHTVLLPGPPSVAALLTRAGLKTRGKVEVATAIASCDESWLRGLLVESQGALSPVAYPVHFGVQRQLEIGKGMDWVANWSAVTGLKAGWALSPLALGRHFYRERLLMQVL